MVDRKWKIVYDYVRKNRIDTGFYWQKEKSLYLKFLL